MRTGIALGSNLGDRLKNLQAASDYLRSLSRGPFLISHAYETEPVDCPPGSGAFLNAAAEIEFHGDIFDLLSDLQEYEQRKGRPSEREKNAPRPIDLDILYCDDMTLSSPALNIPHPAITDRAFVLAPLAEICPKKRLPNHSKTFEKLYKEMNVKFNDNEIYKLL
ncbi:MAG: 2-amino-4-hydroxy-6-hydroxymethyldihydropteridine diphosphokinase [Chthoniobacterales bacterium]